MLTGRSLLKKTKKKPLKKKLKKRLIRERRLSLKVRKKLIRRRLIRKRLLKVQILKRKLSKKYYVSRYARQVYKNKQFFKNNMIFVKKLFMTFVKRGLKVKAINMFISFLNYVILKTIKKRWIGSYNLFKKTYKTISFHVYIYQVKKKVFPIFNNLSLSRKGENMLLPWLLFSNKIKLKRLNKVCCNWVKKSVNLRKEKTLFLRILSEIESIRKNNSNSINLKKEYYNVFYKNKYFIKFLKKKNWI